MPAEPERSRQRTRAAIRTELAVGELILPVLVKTVPRARRISLRLDEMGGGLVIVLPSRAGLAEGLAFARSQGEWIRRALAALPSRVPFAEGASLPFLGLPHVIHHEPESRRGVWVEEGCIHVGGASEFLSRRLTDWLKRRARDELAATLLPMAERVGRRVQRIVVSDPRTRWGSCTAKGRLAFSWRLVLAPSPVLAYVAAHEVAHLVEMNHSPAFWRVVETLVTDARDRRAWLRRHGAELRRYG